jgi:hypothetical protein
MDTIQLQSNGRNALGTLAIGAITISPSNPNVVYIGTGEQANGAIGNGLYRIDNATTATPTLAGPINPMADYGDNGVLGTFTFRAISQIVVHPEQPGTIFVSTAPGKAGIQTHNATTPPNVPNAAVMGVYRSTNATAAANSVTFTKLKVNNEGSTGFIQPPIPPTPTGNTDISDMVLDPSDATFNTLVVWVRSGDGATSNPACTEDCTGIYRSTNALGQGTFTPRLVALNAGARGELSIAMAGSTATVLAATEERPTSVPGNPNTGCGNAKGLLRRSVDGGVTWPNTNSTTASAGGLIRSMDGFCGGQCFYDIGVALDPTNANLIHIGGNANATASDPCQVLTRRSTNGVNFDDNSNGLHADVHAFTVSRSNPMIVWTGNDGGVWRSTDAGATWVSMNGDPATSTSPAGKLSSIQYVSMATHPRDREYMTGGTQDNGTQLKRALSDTGMWRLIAEGDGGYTAIDQNATDVDNVTIYHTFFNLIGSPSTIEFERVTTTANANPNGWTNFSCVAGGANNTKIDCNDTAVSFYAPLVLGPGNPNTVYFGTDRLYRSADQGTTMQRVSQASIAGSGVEVTSISIARTNDNVRLVGMRNGTVWATTTGSTTLVDVTPAGRTAGVPVGKVYIDPNNSNTAYIAYGGLGTTAAPITHLWKTTDLAGGAGTWVAMSNGLPDVPIDAIVADRLSSTGTNAATTLYLGTDIGVYRSTDGGTNWAVFNPGNTLPVVPIFDMAFQQNEVSSTRILRIATHGRGIWEIDTANSPVPSAVVSRRVHGGTPFDIALPLTGAAGIESRSGGSSNNYQLVFTFPTAVTFTNAAVASGTGSVASTSGSGTNTVIVNLTGVTSQQRITVTLLGVNAGSGAGDVSAQMGVLVGDVNADSTVNSGDALVTRNASGQQADATNFRTDVNVDGSVNGGDTIVVRGRTGNTLLP